MPIPNETPPVSPQRPATRPPLSRADLQRGSGELLNQGRWANAVLYRLEQDGAVWVVKDFRPRAFLVRNLIGRALIRHEVAALQRVAGLAGAPQAAFRIDAHALAYRFVPGRCLRGLRGGLGPNFFPRLERQLRAMHATARVVHLDLRNARNILVDDRGEPHLIDFQSAIRTRWLPGPLRRLAEALDLAGIYKHWRKHSPDTLGAQRETTLSRVDRLRPLWAARGYFGVHRSRRQGS